MSSDGASTTGDDIAVKVSTSQTEEEEVCPSSLDLKPHPSLHPFPRPLLTISLLHSTPLPSFPLFLRPNAAHTQILPLPPSLQRPQPLFPLLPLARTNWLPPREISAW